MTGRCDLRRKHRNFTNFRGCSLCGYPVRGSRVVVADVGNGKYYYKGVAYCGSAWACMVCAAKIRFQQAGFISQACTKAFVDHELYGVFVTLNMAHDKHDNLRETIKLLSDC